MTLIDRMIDGRIEAVKLIMDKDGNDIYRNDTIPFDITEQHEVAKLTLLS